MEIWIHHSTRAEPRYFDSNQGERSEAVAMLINEDLNEMWDGYQYTIHITVSEDAKTCTSEIIDMSDDAQEIIDEGEQESRYAEAHRRSFSQPSSIQGW
jgi:hypothetical protein